MTRVVLVSPEPIGDEMAGPAVRYHELGRALARTYDVVVAAPAPSRPPPGGAPLAEYEPADAGSLRGLLAGANVVVSPPLAPRLLATAPLGGRRWIVDLYDPEPFEGLERQKHTGRAARRARDVVRIDRVAFAVRAAGAFVCASERQRDMWLGFLAASRRLSSDLYARDPDLRSLIDVVPFGVPDEPPSAGREPILRGRLLRDDARIVVWNGGLWPWLDPGSVLEATAVLHRDDPRWAVVFLGTERPGRDAPSLAGETRSLAERLGLVAAGAAHFAGWTRYAERGALLLEADVGAIAHRPTLETRFAHRSRALDLVWAGVPIASTSGDEWSDRIAALGLGATAPPGEPGALADALRTVVERGRSAYAGALRRTAEAFRWSTAAEALAAVIERSPPAPRPGLVAGALAARHGAAELAGRLAATRAPRRER